MQQPQASLSFIFCAPLFKATVVTKASWCSSTMGDGLWLGLHYYPRREMRRSEVKDDGSLVRAWPAWVLAQR